MRLDVLIHESGLATSREAARRLIMAGGVLVNDSPASKAGAMVLVDSTIRVKAKPRFVSRGGEKLVAALKAFDIHPLARDCADVGASSGGFTDCLLKMGARLVYAIDVGYGQLDWGLRQDKRVVVMERTNARYIASLPTLVDLAVIDVSFISLKLILPAVQLWLKSEGQVVALVKPQFEAGRGKVGKGGVIRDSKVHAEVLETIIGFSEANGFVVNGLIPSPLRGPSGNIEFLLFLVRQHHHPESRAAEMIRLALESSFNIR